MSFCKSFAHDDPKNLEHTRTVKNTPWDEFNCAGYALGTFSWYLLDDLRLSKCKYEEMLARATFQLLEDFPSLRHIESLEEVGKHEEVIALRLAPIDFHFMVRKLNGIWYQKRGSTSGIHRVKVEDVFAEVWDNGWLYYDSPITLFAKTI